MKRNVIILVCWGIMTSLFSQNQTEGFAPVNPEFLQYQEAGSTNALIPPVYSTPFDSLPALRTALILPDKFDLRTTGLLTAPRNQGSVNACWTFATLDAIQSSWARMGFSTPLCSPENLANCHGFDKLKDEGGNGPMAIAYLSRYGGLVYETSDPFINNPIGTCNTSITKNDKDALVSQVINIPKDVQTIKQMVYRYGGVLTAVSITQLTNSNYYNPDSFSVFMKTPPIGNVVDHAGTIVGWDDNQVVYNPVGDNPLKPGVWIIKNTAGTGNFDGGYYYASYEDCHIGSYAYVFPQRIEKSRVDTIFYYDKLGRITNYGSGVKDSAIVVIKFNTPTQKLITAIGTYASVAATTIDIQIYQTKTGEVLSGLLGEKKALFCEYPGFYSFDLPVSVTGDYYVKIKYKTPGYLFPIPIEKSVAGFSTVVVKPIGYQWLKYAEGDTLRTVGLPSRQFNLCCKVYAQNAPNQPLFSTSKNKYCVNDTVVFKNTSVGTYDSYNWDFGVGAVPLTATTTLKTDTFKVVYATGGMKKVTLKATSGVVTDSIVKGNAVEILSGVPLSIISSINNDTILKNKEITLTAYGADNYHWVASSSFPDIYLNKVTFTIGEIDEEFKVIGLIGQCVGADSIKFIVVDKCAPYDDIEDAKTLAVNIKEGPFSNACATWQQNEPCPLEAASCTLQNGWCPGDAKLHNSLWFKFTAPTNDSVKIISSGFDNQLALYDAVSTGTYADIISGIPANYNLLAANDDSTAVQVAATIRALKLTPGKTYWLQMDGSYGGVEGSAYITVIGFNGLGISDEKIDVPSIINPAKNGFVTINNAQIVTQAELLDITGKVLKTVFNEKNPTMQMDVSSLRTGYYLLKLKTTQGFVTCKVLIE